MQHLLGLLRGQAIDCATDEAEWGNVLALAEEEHVLPWVAARLRSHEASLTPTISDRVRAIERDAAIAAFYWSSELKGLLRTFDEKDLRVIPLKGPFLAKRLYGKTELRACQDLDLLVSKRDLARAEAVLTAIGFTPGTPDDYHRQWYRGTTTVELHHDVVNPLAFNFDIEGAVQQARPAVFEGQRCLKLRPEDELLFLCLHAVRHRYERLSLALDLKLAFEGLVVPGDEWLPRPALAKLDILMALGLTMARRLQPNLEEVDSLRRR